jgi:type VI secretion system protein ImpK
MTGPFAALVGPVLEHVLSFREALRRGEQPPLEAEKRAIIRLVYETDKRAAEIPAVARDFALARYALVYYIDEILITSAEWQHAAAWKNAILEIHYFGAPRRAAQDFWARAVQAETLARGGKGADALETFYLCAALGFRGEMVLDQAELARWFDRVYPIIYTGFPASNSAPHGEVRWGLRPLAGGRLLVCVAVLISVTALLTVLAFIAAVHAQN